MSLNSILKKKEEVVGGVTRLVGLQPTSICGNCLAYWFNMAHHFLLNKRKKKRG
jgi:hypothetical protein